jgi:hypothetical protein
VPKFALSSSMARKNQVIEEIGGAYSGIKADCSQRWINGVLTRKES